SEYQIAETRARNRFPGSFEAGPANYPVERHCKAWARVHRLYEEYRAAERRLGNSIAHREHTARLTEWTDAAAGEFIAGLKPGDRVRIRWTNCGRQYSAVALVHKLNARTIVIELADEIPDDYLPGIG